MNVTANEHVTFLMACLESQRDDITLLNSELELLMSCSAPDDEIPAEDSPNHDHDGVNLDIPDPKSQRAIDRMLPQDAKRFNEATLAEVNGMKKKRRHGIANAPITSKAEQDLSKCGKLDLQNELRGLYQDQMPYLLWRS
jgi:hypothetical protein